MPGSPRIRAKSSCLVTDWRTQTTLKSHIPEHIIEDIRNRSDILEVVSESVLLKKSGKNHKGLCPFHSEKTPSFTVSPEKQIYHCFGCGAGGNVFRFLMEREDLSFVDAVRKLAQRYQISLPETSRPGDSARHKEREALWQLNKATAEYFSANLRHPQLGQQARDYLDSRKFDTALIEKYQIGWALPEWRGLLDHLMKKGNVSRPLLEKFGLISKKEGQDTYYDRFRGRIIFPIKDVHGNVIAFGGRVIAKEEPKYLNSPETPVYKKGRHLFGLDLAREAIRKANQVLIVEGYFDQMRAWQNGIHNVVATCGTALTVGQVGLIKSRSHHAVLVFDADTAGQAAAERGYEVLLDQGMAVQIATLPKGHDPDSLLLEQGRDGFMERIQQAQTFIHYYVEKTRQSVDIKTPEGKLEAVNRILPWLGKIQSSVERSECVRHVAETLAIEDRALLEELKKSLAQNKPRVTLPEPAQQTAHSPELYLIHLMIADPATAQEIRRQVTLEEFKDSWYRETARLFYSQIDDNLPIRIDRLLDLTSQPEVKSVLTRIGLAPLVFDNIDRAVRDCIAEIKKSPLEEKINELRKERNAAQQAGQTDRSRELHEIMRKIQFSLSPE